MEEEYAEDAKFAISFLIYFREVKLLSEIDVWGKRVFLRADLDVDVESPADSVRLQNLEPTVKYLLGHSVGRILIAGHIGRPQGPDPSLSTKNLLETLKNILGQEIFFQGNFEQENGGKLVLFENLRFWSGEEVNDPNFARQLAGLADTYVNESFAVSHRAQASMVGVPALLPHASGIHLEKEVSELSKLLENPTKPFVAIVGGAKIETKAPVIGNLAKIANMVLVGGLIAKELITEEKVLAAKFTKDGKDIDQESIDRFIDVIQGAKTVVWNGPMGYFEGGFEKGTMAVAQAIVESGTYSVVGGGETTEFLAGKNLLSKFSFVSSGGGAMLEFLAGKKLPAIEALA